MIEINWHPTDRQLRQFAGIWLPLAVVIGLFWLWHAEQPAWLLALLALLAAVLCGVGIWQPQWLRPVFVGWLCAAFPIGWMVSHTALAISYYLLITPLGLVLRCLGRDPLRRRLDHEAATYWIERRETRDDSRYFSQF